tara:strand:- start:15164 stop:15310 length:147 start_codon:yes stop_codon:yes gene_type:complete
MGMMNLRRMPALRVVASRQAEGGEEKIEYGGWGGAKAVFGALNSKHAS